MGLNFYEVFALIVVVLFVFAYVMKFGFWITITIGCLAFILAILGALKRAKQEAKETRIMK